MSKRVPDNRRFFAKQRKHFGKPNRLEKNRYIELNEDDIKYFKEKNEIKRIEDEVIF